MKSLKAFLVLAMAIAMCQTMNAQTWSFDVSEWSTNCGSVTFDKDANTITATGYQWGCVGLVFNGNKTVGVTQDRLCITGRYLSRSSNSANPNINSMVLGASATQVCSSQLRAEKVNDSQTLVVFNLAEKFASIAESDREADGTIKVSNMGFYINETKSGETSLMFVITDMQFLTADEAEALAASLESSEIDPYAFDASQWTCASGSFDTSAPEGIIRAASYSWGCLGIEYNGKSTVPSHKTYVVVKGKNIIKGSSNPNINELAIDGTKVNEGQVTMTVNEEETIAYADVSSLFAACADKQLADGSLVLTKLKMFLQQPADGADPVEVSNVAFMTNDELQLALLEEKVLPDYAFNVADWSCTCGGFTADQDANTIVSTSYAWGCVGLLNQTVYCVDTNKDQLVIRGQNLKQGTNNPCIYALEFSGADQLNGAKPLMTANDEQTMCVYSLTDIFEKAADKVTNGKLTLTKLGFYLQENDVNLTVESIDFMTKDDLETITTGINEIVNIKSANSVYYDLQGRCVSNPQKGIYIINGKKINIK